MITAAEALTLSSAQLSPSDVEGIRIVLTEIEEKVRSEMTRNGCVVKVDPNRLNGRIIAEVVRACQRLGWIATIQGTPSALAGGQLVLSGIQLMPSEVAYAEYEAKKANGVSERPSLFT